MHTCIIYKQQVILLLSYLTVDKTVSAGLNLGRRRLNHFYVEPPECFHRAFASASKSASDATDSSARNFNLDARVFCVIFRFLILKILS